MPCNIKQLNVIELFLDCLTEPSEKLVEFGIGGICNACAGKIKSFGIYVDSMIWNVFCWFYSELQ